MCVCGCAVREFAEGIVFCLDGAAPELPFPYEGPVFRGNDALVGGGERRPRAH